MADFEIKIALLNDREVAYTSDAKLTYKASIRLDELTKKLLDRFNFWVSMDNSPFDRTDLELFGRVLYTVLFPAEATGPRENPGPSIRELFEKEYAQFYKKSVANDRFRLTLELYEEARILGKYPWEFLFIPPEEKTSERDPQMDRGFFLAGERNKLILTRFVPKVPQDIVVKTEDPLRILVVFSHPRELPDINSQTIRDLIQNIQDLEKLKHIEVRLEENPTYNQVYQLMNGDERQEDAEKPPEQRVRFKPDILHFIGHGQKGQLAMFREKEDIQADEDDGKGRIEAYWCDSQQVLDLFANYTPRLAFLHACESATPSSVQDFSDLARDLVYAKVPVVVAMQYTILNKDAALFAKTFYESIRNGNLIDEAVRAGREALGQAQDKRKSWGDRRFGTPVVYFQTQSERALIKVPRDASTSGSTSGGFNSDERVDCPNPKCESHPLYKIPLGSVICVMCQHELKICPNCESQKGEYHLMSVTMGLCGYCGYRQERAGTGGAAARTPSSQQAEAESAPIRSV
jgi:hypothetical protein